MQRGLRHPVPEEPRRWTVAVESQGVNPKVSIALPVRNAAAFLDERIDTIRNQTFQDYEVVVVDGFSKDGSWEKLERWAMEDPRVRCERQQPEGVYAALNRCIGLALGPYIYIATADDTMASDCLEKLLGGFATFPESDIVSSMAWMIDENGNEMCSKGVGDIERKMAEASSRVQWMNTQELALAGLCRNRTPALSLTQLLIRRSAFDRVGLFPTQFGSAGDWAWEMKAVGMAQWAFVPEKLGSWRRHSTQATARTLADVRGYRQAEACMGLWLVEHGAELRDRRLNFSLGRFIAQRSGSMPQGNLACAFGYLAERAQQFLR